MLALQALLVQEPSADEPRADATDQTHIAILGKTKPDDEPVVIPGLPEARDP